MQLTYNLLLNLRIFYCIMKSLNTVYLIFFKNYPDLGESLNDNDTMKDIGNYMLTDYHIYFMIMNFTLNIGR